MSCKRPSTHLQEDSAAEKTLFYILDVTSCLGIEERRPGICSDHIVLMTFADTSPHTKGEDSSSSAQTMLKTSCSRGVVPTVLDRTQQPSGVIMLKAPVQLRGW